MPVVTRSMPPWWEGNATEPTVALIFRDFVRPGNTVFDVGAFVGDMSFILSRLTGPKGNVVSFEANASTLPQLTENMKSNICNNVFIVNRAIGRKSGHYVNLDSPDLNPAASRVVNYNLGYVPGGIETLALDDFVRETSIVPDFCKLDIEGAEYDAFCGFERTLSLYRTPLVFEHEVGHDDALTFVRELGYETFCSTHYTPVHSSADLLEGSTIRNIVAVHKSRIRETIFGEIDGSRHSRTFKASDANSFEQKGETIFEYNIPTEGGRFVVEAIWGDIDFNSSYMFLETLINNTIIGKYYVDQPTFLTNCRDISLSARSGDQVAVRIGAVSSIGFRAPDSLVLTQVGGIKPRAHTFV
ncbi:FkbM family methyltransferase [Azorhizobium sp. AG788]|uniref:FkbM family methyltransferase n=1 Tax=Azorhizobium sp. AG788 TaxID=2183897 RepID=UPI0010608F6C|nr:FkbM family methyltransferase [Azorhizobium sp. AG788]TDT96948.1 FkbM family methyltransferase [Azorhizobium sp. AG788]